MENYTFEEIKHKLEYYCSYQDRCHKEVEQKLNSFTLITALKEKVIVHLIENNFINEERFAKSFARGKHNYKGWGKNRIVNELKFRNISSRIITIALKEIPEAFTVRTTNAIKQVVDKVILCDSCFSQLEKLHKFCPYCGQQVRDQQNELDNNE